jgi:hypothetical protein
LDKVASLAEMLLKAKEKLSQGHTNSPQELVEHQPIVNKVPPGIHSDTNENDPSIKEIPDSQILVASKKSKKKDKPSGAVNEISRPKVITTEPQPIVKRIPKDSQTISKSEKKPRDRKQNSKVAKKRTEESHVDGNEEEEDEGSVIEKYFMMKRKAQEQQSSTSIAPPPPSIRIRSKKSHEEEEEEDAVGLEYVPASPMFPMSGDLEDESFPLDLPLPSKRHSPLIDSTPLDLSYFGTSKEQLLDHKSHSILEGDEEEDEGKEGAGDGSASVSFDRGNYAILEEEDEEQDEEEKEGRPHAIASTGEEMVYEDDWEEGNGETALNKSHNNQWEESDEGEEEEDGEEESSRDGHEREREDDVSDATSVSVRESSDDYEKLLNFECENLRRRLEEKMVLSQQAQAQDQKAEGNTEQEENEEEGEEEEEEEDYGDDYEEEEEEEEGDL